MKWNTNEQNKENADLNVVLKRELAEKYRNAIPLDMSESTFGKCNSGTPSWDP